MRPRWWAYASLASAYASTIIFVQLRQAGSPFALPAGIVLVGACAAIASEAVRVSRSHGGAR